MALHFAPGLYVERPLPRPTPVAVRMDVAGFVGIAQRGPIGRAVALDGWPAFVATFGDFIPNGLLAYAVRGFFENGGRRCHVVRAAASAVETATAAAPQPSDGQSSIVLDAGPIKPGSLVMLWQSATTMAAGPQPADRLSSIVADARGFAPGAVAVLRQPGAPVVYARPRDVDTVTNAIRWQEALSADLDITLPFALEVERRDRRLVAAVAGSTITWTQALDPRFDRTLPIHFAAGAAPASGTICDEDGRPLLSVTASSPGQWGDELSVFVTRTTASETRSKRRNSPDPAVSLTVERIIDLAAGATVEVLQDGVTPVRRLIASIDRKANRLTWDAALPPAFDRVGAANGTKPIRVRRRAFSLSISRRGRLLETFSDLDLPTIAEPDDSLVNLRSAWIRIRRLASLTSYPLPDPLSLLLHQGRCLLRGGRDGIAMLTATDFTGDATSPRRWGLRVFETEDEPAALAVPDAVIEPMPAIDHAPLPEPEPDPCDPCPKPPEPAPSPPPPVVEATPVFGPEDVFAIASAFVEHCEARGDRIAVLDPPLGRDRPDPYDLDALLAWRQRFDSSYAASYFPWLILTDPLSGPRSLTRTVPPSGHAAGAFAATDLGPGTQSAPANISLAWAAALPRAITTGEHEGLNPVGINCIRGFLGRGIRIYGARTLSSLTDWQLLNVRRLIIRLKRILARSMQWAVFEPNNNQLVDTAFAMVEGFLETEWSERRLAGTSPEEAFYVRQLQSQDIYDNGQFILEIGVAPVLPAEFVVLRLSRNEDRLEIAERTEPEELTS